MQHCYCEANGTQDSIRARCCKCGHEVWVRDVRDLGPVDERWHAHEDKLRDATYETTARGQRPLTKGSGA